MMRVHPADEIVAGARICHENPVNEDSVIPVGSHPILASPSHDVDATRRGCGIAAYIGGEWRFGVSA